MRRNLSPGAGASAQGPTPANGCPRAQRCAKWQARSACTEFAICAARLSRAAAASAVRASSRCLAASTDFRTRPKRSISRLKPSPEEAVVSSVVAEVSPLVPRLRARAAVPFNEIAGRRCTASLPRRARASSTRATACVTDRLSTIAWSASSLMSLSLRSVHQRSPGNAAAASGRGTAADHAAGAANAGGRWSGCVVPPLASRTPATMAAAAMALVPPPRRSQRLTRRRHAAAVATLQLSGAVQDTEVSMWRFGTVTPVQCEPGRHVFAGRTRS